MTANDGNAAGGAAGAAGQAPAIRASDRERDAVLQQVQEAFAEGRLDDAEFDQRMRAALVARTRADLDALLADLPAAESGAPPAGAIPAVAIPTGAGRRPGRLAVALKCSVRRAGRWRVPERYTTVPPCVRVEMTGFGVTQGDTKPDPGYRLPVDAPVLHVRGLAYKGTIEITTRPPAPRPPSVSTGGSRSLAPEAPAPAPLAHSPFTGR